MALFPEKPHNVIHGDDQNLALIDWINEAFKPLAKKKILPIGGTDLKRGVDFDLQQGGRVHIKRDEVSFNTKAVNDDEAIKTAVLFAKKAWGGEIKGMSGTPEFKAKMYAYAKLHGVTIDNYIPSPEAIVMYRHLAAMNPQATAAVVAAPEENKISGQVMAAPEAQAKPETSEWKQSKSDPAIRIKMVGADEFVKGIKNPWVAPLTATPAVNTQRLPKYRAKKLFAEFLTAKKLDVQGGFYAGGKREEKPLGQLKQKEATRPKNYAENKKTHGDVSDKKPNATGAAEKPTTHWRDMQGGVDALDAPQKAAAEAAYLKWKETVGEAKRDFSLGEYVAYAQDKQASKREEKPAQATQTKTTTKQQARRPQRSAAAPSP